MFLQFIINGLITGVIYGVVALGFALIYNTTRIFHIAYAALYMVAPYFLMLFMQLFGLPVYTAIFFALIATAILGLLIDFSIYSPLIQKNNTSNVVMVSSIGAMIIIINLVAMFFGNETKTINSSISESITFGSIIITHTQILQLVVSIVILTGFFIFLKYSKFGIQTRAYRDDQKLLEVIGVNAKNLRIILFALSSILAAIGSCLVAYDVGMDPYVGMPMLLNAVVALIIGGVGRFEAPVLGGLLIGILQALVVYFTSARWQDAVTFSLLIVFLLLKPQGILGEKMRTV